MGKWKMRTWADTDSDSDSDSRIPVMIIMIRKWSSRWLCVQCWSQEGHWWKLPKQDVRDHGMKLWHSQGVGQAGPGPSNCSYGPPNLARLCWLEAMMKNAKILMLTFLYENETICLRVNDRDNENVSILTCLDKLWFLFCNISWCKVKFFHV